jgi:hypothetical protein
MSDVGNCEAGTIKRHSTEEPEVMYCHIFNENRKG